MSKNERPLPRVDELVVEEVRNAFRYDYVLKRSDLNAEQKIAYLIAIDEVVNYLDTCSKAHGY